MLQVLIVSFPMAANYKKFIDKLYLIGLVLLLCMPSKAFAGLTIIDSPGTTTSQDSNGLTQLKPSTLSDDLSRIWTKAQGYIGFLGLLAAAYIIWNGIRYVLSQGDPKKTEEIKRSLLQAVLAVALIVGAFVVVSFIWALAQIAATGASL